MKKVNKNILSILILGCMFVTNVFGALLSQYRMELENLERLRADNRISENQFLGRAGELRENIAATQQAVDDMSRRMEMLAKRSRLSNSEIRELDSLKKQLSALDSDAATRFSLQYKDSSALTQLSQAKYEDAMNNMSYLYDDSLSMSMMEVDPLAGRTRTGGGLEPLSKPPVATSLEPTIPSTGDSMFYDRSNLPPI